MDSKMMVKILITSLLLMSHGLVIAADQWTPTVPASADVPSAYPAAALANNNTLSRILANYRRGEALSFVSTTSVSVSAGEVVCTSTSPLILRQNTSNTALTASNLDSGSSFANSTTYYVYAVCDANATTNTFLISSNATTPTGGTNYRKIGTFTTDGSANILAATVASEAFGPVMADTSGNKEVQGIFDYATSTSSSTFKTGNLKVAYGQTGTSIGGSSSITITNLPFTSSSSYTVLTGQYTSFNCAVSGKSATQFTLTNTHGDAVGGNGNCDWMAIGT